MRRIRRKIRKIIIMVKRMMTMTITKEKKKWETTTTTTTKCDSDLSGWERREKRER